MVELFTEFIPLLLSETVSEELKDKEADDERENIRNTWHLEGETIMFENNGHLYINQSSQGFVFQVREAVKVEKQICVFKKTLFCGGAWCWARRRGASEVSF